MIDIFTRKQKSKAQKLFQEVFDIYLRKVSNKTYPIIYHTTNINNHKSIKLNGLTNKRNYFLEYDNDLLSIVDNEKGIVCGVDYRNIIDRLYPDPEWEFFPNIVFNKLGNPSNYNKKKIDIRDIFCYWVKYFLNLDLNNNISLNDISEEKIQTMIDDNMFCWLFVKGKISKELLTITIHPDLIKSV